MIGSSTLGKGLVQTIAPLPDGGELFVTWSRVLAPRGWPIQGLGVLPQVCTSLGQDTLSWQLAALAQGRQTMTKALETHRAARAPLQPAQILAIRKACPAAEGREADLDTARLLIRDPAAYAAALLPPLTQQRSGVDSRRTSRHAVIALLDHGPGEPHVLWVERIQPWRKPTPFRSSSFRAPTRAFST